MTTRAGQDGDAGPVTVAHLTTVASSLRYLLLPQMRAVAHPVGISAPGDDVTFLEAEGIRHVTLSSSTRSMNPVADLRAAWELWRILRRERIDVLHTHNPKPGLYGRVVGRLAGVPVVVNTNHGLYATENDGLLRRFVVWTLEAIAARFSDAELIQSPEDLSLLTHWHINPRAHTRLLGNGVDLNRFRPGALPAAERAALRADWGAGDDTVVVGMVGRLVVEKGCRELFEAARLLRKLSDDPVRNDRNGRVPPGNRGGGSRPRVRFVVIGPDDPEKADAISADEVRRAEQDGVVFLGHRDDVDRLYHAMDVFVLPSYREGFPRAAMEAAACGLPVVATDVRGCRQVVDHGETGLLVPVRDAESLAAAIADLADDPDRRARMGKASAVKAESEFDEQRIVDLVLATYRQVATRKGHPTLAAAFEPAPDTTVTPARHGIPAA